MASACVPADHTEPAAPVPTAVESPAATAVQAEPPAPSPVERRSAQLGRGGTLDARLADLGLEPVERAAALDEFGRHLDLRRLPPATGVAVTLDAAGAVLGLSCRPALDRYVRLRPRAAGGWQGEEVLVPIEVEVVTVGGIVQQSVAQALSEATESTRLTAEFAHIFQWDVDLLVEPRRGDRVRVVHEVRRLGALPDDLPPWGDVELEAGARLGMGRILAASYDGKMVRSSAFWVGEAAGGGGYFDAAGEPLHKTFLKSPLNYTRISSRFSRARRHPVTRKVVPHHGVDFVAPRGTPVVATADGRVARLGWQGALGRAVTLRHGSGYQSIYGHLSRFAKGIRPGTVVKQNQVIGYVGSTGRATGSHLHYTLKQQGRALDPLRFRSPPARPLSDDERPHLDAAVARWLPVLESIRLDGAGTAVAEVEAEEAASPGFGI